MALSLTQKRTLEGFERLWQAEASPKGMFGGLFGKPQVSLDFIKRLIESRTTVDRTACDTERSRQQFELASNLLDNPRTLQQGITHLAKAIYLHPWNREALTVLGISTHCDDAPVSIPYAQRLEWMTLVTVVLEEDGDSLGSTMIRADYQWKIFSRYAEKTCTMEELEQSRRLAASYVSLGEKVLQFVLPYLEEPKAKEVIIDLCLKLGVASGVLERPAKVEELRQLAMRADPGNHAIGTTFAEYSNIAHGALREAVLEDHYQRQQARSELAGTVARAGSGIWGIISDEMRRNDIR